MITNPMARRYAVAPVIGVFAAILTLLSAPAVAAQPPLDAPAPGVITYTEADNGRQLSLTEAHQLTIRLEANPSAGYLWETSRLDETVLVRQQGDEPEFFSPSSEPGTGPVYQVLRFAALSEGQTTLELAYRRAWERDPPPLRTFTLSLQTVGPFTGANIPPPAGERVAVDVPASDIVAAGLPGHFNWCEKGDCTPIRDQGMCGSCWAFATAGVMEAVIKIQDGVERDLSEQYLVSCNTNGWSCNGGYWAHSYYQNRVPPSESDAGVVYEVDFPYQAKNVPCGPAHPHHEKITSWDHVAGYGLPSVSALKQAIYAYGPVTAGVCVGSAFGNYKGGIFATDETSKCPYGTNHAVVLVGWDDATGIWYLRNSWGTHWGENGMMRIKYGVSQVGEDASRVVYGNVPYLPVAGPILPTVRIFLPTIARNSSPTSEAVPAPTPPPSPAMLVPANGSFEDGAAVWTEYSRQGWQVILGATDLTVAPHSGEWAAWLGGDNDEVSSVTQPVMVPTAGSFLAYWHWINSSDSCGGDTAGVVVNGSTVVQSYDLCAATNTGGWAKRVVDLSAYAGQSVSLQIRVETNAAGTSNLYVDDVRFQTSLADESPAPAARASRVRVLSKPAGATPSQTTTSPDLPGASERLF